ncbi:MAG: sigma-70 family RNA polymerase sigma factor [Terriglobia bacterium]
MNRSTPLLNAIEKEVVTLYETCASGLLRYGMGLVSNRELVEEGLQECYLRFFIARSEGQTIENPKAWLYRVLRNYLLDRLKEAGEKNKVSLEVLVDQVDLLENPEKAYIRMEALQNVEKLLAPRELECLRLRVEGFDYNEIANILGIRPGTIGATLARALNKISAVVKKPITNNSRKR